MFSSSFRNNQINDSLAIGIKSGVGRLDRQDCSLERFKDCLTVVNLLAVPVQ